MHRTLSGWIFGFAYLCASIALAGFLLQRTAFEPGRTGDAAGVVLADTEIRQRITFVLADAVAAALAVDPISMRARVEQVATSAEGTGLLAKVVADVHSRLIGAADGPVVVTPAQLVDATQMQVAGDLNPLTIDIPTMGGLRVVDRILTWAVPIAALAALALVAAGFAARPERDAVLRMLATGLLTLAGITLLIGHIVPRWLLPALVEPPWGRVPALLADAARVLVLGLTVFLAAAGAGLLMMGGMLGRRRQWRAPVSMYRYQEERRWS